MNTGSGEIRDTAPVLFTRSAWAAGLKKYDRVMIHGEPYQVVDPGWDESGTAGQGVITITLARGSPGEIHLLHRNDRVNVMAVREHERSSARQRRLARNLVVDIDEDEVLKIIAKLGGSKVRSVKPGAWR